MSVIASYIAGSYHNVMHLRTDLVDILNGVGAKVIKQFDVLLGRDKKEP